jgi:hypothetical protein
VRWGLALTVVVGLVALPAAAAPVDEEGPSWGRVVETVVGFVADLLGGDVVVIELDGEPEHSESDPTDPPPDSEGGPDLDPNG